MAAPVTFLNAEVVNAFVEPVFKILKTCAGIDGALTGLELVNEIPQGPSICVSIEVRGTIYGPIRIAFDQNITQEVTAKMLALQLAPDYDSPQCLDAVAELTNIILGSATGTLMDAGYPVELATPETRLMRPDGQRAPLARSALKATVSTSAGKLDVLIGVNLTPP